MIPRSIWRQFANSSSARDKEKESKRWALEKIEERNRPTPLPSVCLTVQKKQAEKNAYCTIKSNQQNESDFKPRNSCSEFRTSSRSKLWKDNMITYLQNQICVLKLYPVWFLLCYTCHVYSLFVWLLVFV
ncbi:hypothetical protein FF1_022783 [Malus domestica]